MKSLLIISGWAHGKKSIEPIGELFNPFFNVFLLSGADALKSEALPKSDYIIGISMGGILALDKFTSQCKKIVLISSSACFCKKDNYFFGTAEKIIQRMIKQIDISQEKVIDEFFTNAHLPQKLKKSKQQKTISYDGLHEGLHYMLNVDLREKISNINLPILILHGSDDKIIPFEAAEWMHKKMSKSQLKCYNGYGHMISVHAYDMVIKEAKTFLD